MEILRREARHKKLQEYRKKHVMRVDDIVGSMQQDEDDIQPPPRSTKPHGKRIDKVLLQALENKLRLCTPTLGLFLRNTPQVKLMLRDWCLTGPEKQLLVETDTGHRDCDREKMMVRRKLLTRINSYYRTVKRRMLSVFVESENRLLQMLCQ